MATYTAFQGGVSNAGLGDLQVLIDGHVIANVEGSSVTYGDDPELPNVTVELSTTDGTITGTTPLGSWNIQEITIQNKFGLVETITGIQFVDGENSGLADPQSLFQAVDFGGAPRLIFQGNDNTINGGPGNETLVGFGVDSGLGSTVTINANRSGNYHVVCGGGTVNVNLGKGHDVVEFDAVDALKPLANVTTVHAFNAAKDIFDLNGLAFNHLSGTPELLGKEFHIGKNPLHPHHDGIWYNPKDGSLWYDFFSNDLGVEVKDHVATILGHGPHAHPLHPDLTVQNFLVNA